MTNFAKNITWTKDYWIEQAKAAKPGIIGNFIPMIDVSYLHDFAPSMNQERKFEDFIRGVGYNEKKSWFQKIGIEVPFMALDITKVAHFLEQKDDQNESIENAFLSGKRNVFIINVSCGQKDMFYVCEYSDPADALAAYTVDKDELARKRELEATTRSFMNRVRSNRQNKSDNDSLPF